jgi:hypothetical protein
MRDEQRLTKVYDKIQDLKNDQNAYWNKLWKEFDESIAGVEDEDTKDELRKHYQQIAKEHEYVLDEYKNNHPWKENLNWKKAPGEFNRMHNLEWKWIDFIRNVRVPYISTLEVRMYYNNHYYCTWRYNKPELSIGLAGDQENSTWSITGPLRDIDYWMDPNQNHYYDAGTIECDKNKYKTGGLRKG